MSDYKPQYGIDYFIALTEPGGYERPAAIAGDNGADADISWHLKNAIREHVTVPVTYQSNYPANEALPDFLSHNHMMFVSNQFRDVAEPWLKDYEFIPAEIERSLSARRDNVGGGERVPGYWWLNSWRRVDLIDVAQSDLVAAVLPSAKSSSPVRINHWNTLVVKPNAIDGEHLFGVRDVFGAKRYVSPALRDALLDAGLRLRFVPALLRPPRIDVQALALQLNAPP